MSNAVFLCLFSLFCIFGVYSGQVKRYDGYTVFRLTPRNERQLRYLHNLEENHIELSFWKSPTGVNQFVDVMVAPELKSNFRKTLRFNRIPNKVLVPDVEQLTAGEKRYNSTLFSRNTYNWDSYMNYDAIQSFITTTASANPTIVTFQNIGNSYGGNPLRLLKIGANVAANNKPIIYTDCGIHAREWVAPAFCTYLANQLVTGYVNNDATIRPLVTKFDWYILPVVNPDGYKYTWTNDRMWRKTRKPNTGSTCIGTDPNRNWGYQWGGTGASTNPCAETYRGAAAFSEVETTLVSNNILSLGTRVKAYFAVHSYGQYWLYPWGWTSALTPDDAALKRLGNAAAAAIQGVSGTRYSVGTSTNVLYAAAGGADDWAYGTAKVKYSHTVELRDTGSNGFTLPANQITPTGRETTAGFLAFANLLSAEV